MIIKYIFSSQKGSTLLSTLVAFGLVSVSAVGLVQYMGNFKQTTANTIERVNINPVLKSNTINNMKSLLLEKNINLDKEQPTENKYGICSFIQPPKRHHGVEEIKVRFSDASSFTLDRWKVFFPKSHWSHADSSHCQKIISSFSDGAFSRCFRYIDPEHPGKEIYAIAKIIPRKFPSMEEITVPSSIDFNPSLTFFHLKIAVSVYNPSDDNTLSNEDEAHNTSTYISYKSDILWFGDVGECLVQAQDGENAIVSLSATGPGSNFSHRILNSSFFNKANTCEKLELSDINKNVVLAGDEDNLQLSSVVNLNARVACTKKKFSCKQVITTEPLDPESYDPFRFGFHLFNQSYSHITIDRFNLTLKKTNGTELDNSNNEVLDGVDVSFYNSDTPYIPFKGNEVIDHNIPRGTSNIIVVGENEDQALSPYCHDICQTYKPQKQSTYVYPKITIHEKAINGQSCTFTKDYSESIYNRVQCVVCHTKACHRYGLGTFGPLHNEDASSITQNLPPTTIYGLNAEPLDGQIPECTIENNYASHRVLSKNIKGSGENDPGSGCKAMAMKIKNENSFTSFSNRDYTATDCTKKLPVLCFVRGHFLPALKLVNTNNNLKFQTITESFENAKKICFELGKEIALYYDLGVSLARGYVIKNEDGDGDPNLISRTINTLKVLPQVGGGSLGSFNINDSTSTLKYEIINNASRGMFLAPSDYGQAPILTPEIKTIIRSIISHYDKIWTAIEWDAEGLIAASPPWAPVAEENPFSIFYDKRKDRQHRLVVLKDSNKNTTSGKFLALTYNIRFKGLVPQSANTSLPFICKNKNDNNFFITSSKGPLSDGTSICELSNGYFVPPESGLDWAKLMLELNDNDDYYPFPDPKIDEKKITNSSFIYNQKIDTPLAWVAFKSTKSLDPATDKKGPQAKDLRLYPDGYFSAESVFQILGSGNNDKQDIINAIQNSNRFKNKIKKRYEKGKISVILANGLLPGKQPKVGGGLSSKLKNMFSATLELLNFEILDVDNAKSKQKKSITGDFADYNVVCLKDKENTDELTPHKLESIVNVNNKQCSDGTKVLDIDDNPHLFKPTSYKYMSHWIQNGWWGDSTTGTQKIILTPNKLIEATDKFNERIDFLIAGGKGCTSALGSCKPNCKATCPPCVTHTWTDTKGNHHSSTDCSARNACLANCESTCDGALGPCKDVNNNCEDDETSQCLSDSVKVFPY